MTTTEAHRCGTLAEAGACPTCRPKTIALVADGCCGFLLCYPDTRQIAVIRSWDPTGDEAPSTAWATGCNTGGSIGVTPLDIATIEASGVELFTLLSGPDVDTALAALGGGPAPWDQMSLFECSHCGEPQVVDRSET